MLPFRLVFEPGVPLYEQAVFAIKRAIVTGRIRPGDPFPSVRALSKGLRINANTAHKVVTQLVQEGLLEVRVGTGTVVAPLLPSSYAERTRLLKRDLERLAVEAKRLGMSFEELSNALSQQWKRLGGGENP